MLHIEAGTVLYIPSLVRVPSIDENGMKIPGNYNSKCVVDERSYESHK
jgi:hypothetical protein